MSSDLDKAKALSDLVTSEGWKLFQEYIRAQALVYQMKTFESKDAHEMAVNVGAYKAARFLDQWALNTAMQYKQALKDAQLAK